MPNLGTAVGKQFLYVLRDGAMVVDWGDGLVQDLMTGAFMPYADSDFGHLMTDRELDLLIQRRRVLRYDARHVYLAVLPEGERAMLD